MKWLGVLQVILGAMLLGSVPALAYVAALTEGHQVLGVVACLNLLFGAPILISGMIMAAVGFER